MEITLGAGAESVPGYRLMVGLADRYPIVGRPDSEGGEDFDVSKLGTGDQRHRQSYR